LVGVKVTEDIEHRQSFLKVPYKCLMSVQKARDHEVVGKLIRENPLLFNEDCSHDWEQLILFTFIIYEFQKGEESFWWPYLDLMPDFEFFCDWPEKEVFNVQDYGLIFHALDYKKEMQKGYNAMNQLFKKYPDIFP
jgi:hypothetical protein